MTLRHRGHGLLKAHALAICLASTSLSSAGTDSSAVPPPGEDIRDIRGPKDTRPTWMLPAILSAAALLSLSAYGVSRWHRRQRPARPLLPFEVALRRLEGIHGLMTPLSAREFCSAASDIIRSYIEQRFGTVVAQRTTEEFLQDLLQSTHVSLARHRPLLAEFLQRCDIVKFAGISIEPASLESLYQSARAFVNQTAQDEAAVRTREVHDSLPAT